MSEPLARRALNHLAARYVGEISSKVNDSKRLDRDRRSVGQLVFHGSEDGRASAPRRRCAALA
jgi:hypothetical protein